jgi:hypothetical protein
VRTEPERLRRRNTLAVVQASAAVTSPWVLQGPGPVLNRDSETAAYRALECSGRPPERSWRMLSLAGALESAGNVEKEHRNVAVCSHRAKGLSAGSPGARRVPVVAAFCVDRVRSRLFFEILQWSIDESQDEGLQMRSGGTAVLCALIASSLVLTASGVQSTKCRWRKIRTKISQPHRWAWS